VAQLDRERELVNRINDLERERKRTADQDANTTNRSEQTIEELRKKVDEAEKRAQDAERQKGGTTNPTEAPNPGYPPAQTNVVVMDLFPVSVTRSESANENRLVIPRDARSVTLILNSGGPATYSRYSIELLDAQGRTAWRNGNLRRYSNSDFTINLPVNLLRSGRQVINIFGLEPGTKTLMASYQIVIER
jgi:hypothetical protein